MATRYTPQGCTVETTCTIQPNGTYTENVTLSVDPASALALVVEESAGRQVAAREEPTTRTARFRSTKYGVELVGPRR